MSRTSILQVQIGILNALKGDIELMAMVGGRIYDEVPNTEVFPYIAIGTHTENPWNTFDKFGRDVLITLNIYSQYEGYKEALEILDKVVEVLDYKDITIPEFELSYIRYEDATTIRDLDGRTRQIAARFRVFTN